MTDLASLARDGILRAAINTGNRALVTVDGDRLSGPSPDLARRLADEIGARLEPVIYDGAGKVFADATRDAWDVGFLAIDATRARVIGFTRPYRGIDATYAVRDGGPVSAIDDADRPGRTVLVGQGSAYDMHLTATLTQAEIARFPTPGDSFRAFAAGEGDCVAGIRESLTTHFDGAAGIRVLPDAFHRVEQAMVLPDRNDPRLAALDDFVRRAIEAGAV